MVSMQLQCQASNEQGRGLEVVLKLCMKDEIKVGEEP